MPPLEDDLVVMNPEKELSLYEEEFLSLKTLKARPTFPSSTDEKYEVEKEQEKDQLQRKEGQESNRHIWIDKVEIYKDLGTWSILDPKLIQDHQKTKKGGSPTPSQGETHTTCK